jgi:SAM-dependent methyltransferase
VQLEQTEIGNYFCPDDPGEECYGRSEKRRSVTDDEAAILARYARHERVLEIGTGLGVSTRALAATAALVVTVDTDPWVAEAVVPGLPRNVLAVGAVPAVPGQPFGVAFIDGCHEYGSVTRDIEAVRSVLRPGGPVFLHDYTGEVLRAAHAAGLVVTADFETAAALVLCKFPSGEEEAHRERHGLL